MCGPVAQWIRHLTTNQGIPDSNPCGVDYFSYGKRGKTLAQIFYEKQQGGQIVIKKDNKKGFFVLF